MAERQAGGTAGPVSGLRSILRREIDAAERGAWTEFTRLVAEAAEAFAAPAGPWDKAALAELAHLQVRLESLLRGRVEREAERRQRAEAAHAYLRVGDGATARPGRPDPGSTRTLSIRER